MSLKPLLKRGWICLWALLLPLLAGAQTAQQYAARYATLVKNVGVAGVGVETLLDKWEAASPDDIEMLVAKFMFHYTKAQRTEAVRKDQARYLGQDPVISLKDSLGNPVHFFQETFFDDEAFGLGLKYLDRAIQAEPLRLDLRMSRVTALVVYEKESPDMATSDLSGLIDEHFKEKPAWTYPGVENVNQEFFDLQVQDICFTFFRYASPACYAAFKSLSEHMLTYEPDNALFLDNLGSYYLACEKNDRKALKYYNKVLKKHPDDMTAISNCIVLARMSRNVKLEKKYLPMLIQHSTDENAVQAARVRLEFLQGKK